MEPCPLLDFTGGFNKFLAAAYGLATGETISSRFGKPLVGPPSPQHRARASCHDEGLHCSTMLIDILCEGTSGCKAPPESILGLDASRLSRSACTLFLQFFYN